MKIVNVVNSFIGKTGNIGLRSSHIINELNQQKINNFSYSRGVVRPFNKNNKNMGIFGHIPRILNAYRIYLDLWFNHRKFDIRLFDWFLKLRFKDVEDDNKIAHIWESSPNIIKNLKNKCWHIILDVPIAPTATAKNLVNKYKDSIVLHPHQYNSDLELESYQLADYIITPSNFVKDEIIKLDIDRKKILVVPFGVDVQTGYEKNFDKNYQNDGIDFCFAGTVNKRKGVEFLLQAWDDKFFSNDRLHLCGRVYPEIKQLIKKYNFKNIITPGFIDTREYFKKCDVYVFPSLLEGSSKSIYEAMNSSLPCIVTCNSGSVIIDGEDGFIINIADPDSIKNRMLAFKQDNSLIKKMGQFAFQNSKNYSWGVYAQRVVNIYRNIKE
jgi:glycosyltransferase involved in cell wall biosynthesis